MSSCGGSGGTMSTSGWVWMRMRVSLFVGFAQVFAGFDGFGHAALQGWRIADAGAVGADAAEVGQAVGFGGFEAVDGPGQHQGQRVFARAAWARRG